MKEYSFKTGVEDLIVRIKSEKDDNRSILWFREFLDTGDKMKLYQALKIAFQDDDQHDWNKKIVDFLEV
jgi:hypothetical protein